MAENELNFKGWNADIKELAQTQEIGIGDVESSDKEISAKDMIFSSLRSTTLEEKEEEPEFTQESPDKSTIQAIASNKEIRDANEEALALGLPRPGGADDISQGPQHLDQPVVSKFAQAPSDTDPGIIPDNVGGAKISGSKSLVRFRAAISPRGLGGDFKCFG